MTKSIIVFKKVVEARQFGKMVFLPESLDKFRMFLILLLDLIPIPILKNCFSISPKHDNREHKFDKQNSIHKNICVEDTIDKSKSILRMWDIIILEDVASIEAVLSVSLFQDVTQPIHKQYLAS